MKLSTLAAKPKLALIILDDEDTIKEFGEALEFYSWDRQPIDVFMKLANSTQADTTAMIDIVRTLILDEDGKQIIKGEEMLPSNVLVRAIAKIVETLGK
jgi:hypothetical protein